MTARKSIWMSGLACLAFAFSLSASAGTLDELFRQKGDPVAGNPQGKITVVEFFDYQCSHCVNMQTTIAALIKADPQVRVVYKEFPVRGPESELASRAALAANLQGRYLAFNHALFNAYTINENAINQMAQTTGLNVAKLNQDMKGSTVTTQLQHNYDLGRQLGVNGTPTFFIGKTDAQDLNHVEAIYGEASKSELEGAIQKVTG